MIIDKGIWAHRQTLAGTLPNIGKRSAEHWPSRADYRQAYRCPSSPKFPFAAAKIAKIRE